MYKSSRSSSSSSADHVRCLSQHDQTLLMPNSSMKSRSACSHAKRIRESVSAYFEKKRTTWKQTIKDFPFRPAVGIAACRVVEPIAFVSITTYSFEMVKQIRGDDDASFWSALLVSSFAGAEALTAWIWGSLSDKWGRKPCILFALCATAATCLMFGFSRVYGLALAARILGGLLNGNTAVMQTMLSEIVTRKEHEPVIYAISPFMWNVGSMVGSALGGFTAEPARQYPKVFHKGGCFDKYPYSLPNLIAVAFILLSAALGVVLLRESNANVARRRSESTVIDLEKERQDSVDSSASTTPRPSQESHPLVRVSVNEVSEDDEKDVTQKPSTSKARAMYAEFKETFTPQVWAWMVVLWLLSYHQMAFFTLVPTWAPDTSRGQGFHMSGGLGLTLGNVGTIMTVNSVMSLVVQSTIYTSLTSKLGSWWPMYVAICSSVLPYLLMPFVTLLPKPLVGVYIVMSIQVLAQCISYPPATIALKEVCPRPERLGRIVGVAMSGCSLARTIASPLVGIIYSQLGSAAAWWSAAVVAVAGVVQLCFLTKPNGMT